MPKPHNAPRRVASAALMKRLRDRGMMTREAYFAPETLNETERTCEVVWSTGADVQRRDWWTGERYTERLSLEPGHCNLDRLNSGRAPLLDSHMSYGLDPQIGVVERAWIANGEARAIVRFADVASTQEVWAKVVQGVCRNISCGYVVHKMQIEREDGQPEVRTAVDYEIYELSLVAIPADAGAHTRASETGAVPVALPTGRLAPSQESNMPTEASHPAAQPAGDDQVRGEVVQAAAPNSAVTSSAVRGLPLDVAARLTENARAFAGEDGALEARRLACEAGATEQSVRDGVMAFVATRQAAHGQIGRPGRVDVMRDEAETRRDGATEALSLLLGVRGEASETARPYMANRTLAGFVADFIGHRGKLESYSDREDMLRRAMHSTSDFPIILENAVNRSLRARYLTQEPTYRFIAQQRTYQDFRDHLTVRAGDFPQLKPVAESGEIPGGTFGESKEKTAVKAYGVQVRFTRQLLVNDTLGAIQRVLESRATAVARFEEETFYAMMLSASGAGPTLLETGRAVFNTTDGTLASAAAAITNHALGLGRAALRKMKTGDGTFINVAPSVLLTGPDKQTEAETILAAIVPGQASNVNIFSGKLRNEVSAQITGNAWYLFADPAIGANFEWGLLDGFDAPRMRIDEPFGVQGMSMSLEHDFGCGAIDFRFGYRNAGA